MRWVFIHEFPTTQYLTEEQAVEIAKERGSRELAKYLLENATCELRENGSVRITIDI